MHPNLKFKINKSIDEDIFWGVANSDGSPRTLDWFILDKFPQFKKYKQGSKLVNVPKTKVKTFISNFYQKHNKAINKNLKIYKRNWEKVAKDYFRLVDQIIPSKYWPKKGKYIGYPTMWGMFPRYIENCTFKSQLYIDIKR